MTRASLTTLGCAILIATPVFAQDLPVLRDRDTMCVSLDGASRDDMVVLVKMSEKTAANLDAERPADALLSAIGDGGSIAGFGRGTLDTCVETTTAGDFVLVAFSVGDRVTFLGTTTAAKPRRVKTRELAMPGPGGVEIREVKYLADEVIIKVAPGSLDLGGERACFARNATFGDPRLRKAIIDDGGAATIRRLVPNRDDLFVLQGLSCDSYEYCAQRRLGMIAEPNYLIELAGGSFTGPITTQEPEFDRLWGLHNTGQTYTVGGNPRSGTPDADIDAPGAWRITMGSPSVVVAVIDTGIDYTHEDLRTQMWTNPGEIKDNGLDDDGNGYVDDYYGFDFWNGQASVQDADPMDEHFHGTHVSGTIAAALNGKGVIGVAPNVRLMACKIFDANAEADPSTATVVEAVYYATDNGAAVTNNSWGGYFESTILEAAFDDALARDVVSVCAAGNAAVGLPMTPAGYASTFSVAAVDHNDIPAVFSNFGFTVDVAAPGVNVFSTVPTFVLPGGYGYLSGTSMATPHVAGIAALVRSRDRDATARGVFANLRSAVDPLPSDWLMGQGRINARTAVRRGYNPELVARLQDGLNVVTADVGVFGTAAGADFDAYVLEVGIGATPDSWTVFGGGTEPVENGQLGTLPVSHLISGLNTVRLRVLDANGRVDSSMVPINVDNVFISEPTTPQLVRAGELMMVRGSTGLEGFTSYAIEWQPFAFQFGTLVPTGPWTTDGISLAGGGTQPVFGDLLATFDTSVVTPSSGAWLRMTVNGVDTVTEHVTLHVDQTLAPGWPVHVAHDPDHAGALNVLDPVVTDLDHDSVHEIFAFQTGTLYGFDRFGNDLPGFPVTTPNSSGERLFSSSALTVADIDADGFDEILFASVRNQTISIGSIERNGTLTSGFPLSFTYDGSQGPAVIRPNSSVVVDDVDADGVDEIVFQAFDLLVVAETDGTLLPGALIHLRPGGGAVCELLANPPPPTVLDATPAVGDLDRDLLGDLEIVVFRQVPQCDSFGTGNQGMVTVLRADGTILWEHAVSGSALGSSPVMGDLDGDGFLEIVVAAGSTYSVGGVHVLDRFGIPMPGWPQVQASFVSTPALADLDGDGDLEIAVGDNDFFRSIHLFEHTGAPFGVGSIGYASSSYAIAATDADQDGVMDLVSSENPFPLSEWYGITGLGAMARDLSGAMLPGFPHVTEKNAWAPIQLVDLDGDNKLEAIASAFSTVAVPNGLETPTNRGSIYLRDTEIPDNGVAHEWPTFNGNYRRTGRYGD